MASIFKTTKNLVHSVMSIPDRSRHIGFIETAKETISALKEAVHEPFKVINDAKKKASSFAATHISNGIQATGLLDFGSKAAAKACGKKFYEFSGAQGLVANAGKKGLSYVSSLAGDYLGKSAASFVDFLGTKAGQAAEDHLVEKFSETVFLPLISTLRQLAIESKIQGSVELALDTAELWAFGGLDIVGSLGSLQKAATYAEKIANAAKIGSYVYVYGKPALHTAQLAAQCCTLQCRVRKIEKALDQIDLKPYMQACGLNLSEPLVKKTLSHVLAICQENLGFVSSMNLTTMLNNGKILTALISAVSSANKLTS